MEAKTKATPKAVPPFRNQLEKQAQHRIGGESSGEADVRQHGTEAEPGIASFALGCLGSPIGVRGFEFGAWVLGFGVGLRIWDFKRSCLWKYPV